MRVTLMNGNPYMSRIIEPIFQDKNKQIMFYWKNINRNHLKKCHRFTFFVIDRSNTQCVTFVTFNMLLVLWRELNLNMKEIII